MRKLHVPIVDLIRPMTGALIGIALVSGLLTFRIAKLHDGQVNGRELSVIQTVQANSLNGKEILEKNSLYLPHKLGQYALEKSGLTSVRAVRSIGALFGVLGTVAMYIIIRKWHTRRIAILTTALYATSWWFLGSARLATPETCYLLVPWLIYFGIRLQENNLRFLGLGTIFFLVTLMLYIPGLVLFILPVAIWQRERIRKELRQTGRTQTILLALGATITLAPLALSFMNHPSLIADWLGLTADGLTVVEFFKNLIGIPLQLVIRSDADASTHLGRLPYLDIATVTFLALGVYRYFFTRKLDRAKLVAAGLLIGTFLAALNIQSISLLLPFIYILVAAGMAMCLQQWFTVFPRNPLARNIGVVLLIAVLSLVGLYHMRRYYVAWPNTPETKQAYRYRI